MTHFNIYFTLIEQRKRQQKPLDAKNESPARTATEATIRMLNKKVDRSYAFTAHTSS